MTLPTVETEKRPSAPAVVAPAALAALLVARHIGTKPLWRDEAISISVAARPVARIVPVLTHHDANAGLYYLLLHGWLRLGSTGATWARGFSALCFVVAVGLAAWAGARWRGWPVGLACGLLMAANPFLIYYGQETRPYALTVCLAVASTVALFWRRGEPAPLAYTVVSIALLYADLFALLFVAAVAAGVVLARRSTSEPVPPVLLRCWVVIAAVSAPLALVMVLGQSGQIAWVPPPRLIDLGRTFYAMASGWLGLVPIVVLGVLALVAAVSWRPRRERPAAFGLAAGFAVPPPLLFATALIVPCFIDRYVISSAVAMIGLVALGLDEARRRAGMAIAAAVLALLVGLAVQHTVAMEAGRHKVDDAPGAVAMITSQAVAGDAIAYAGGGLRIVIQASLRGAGPFPQDVALRAGGEAFRQHDLYAREVGPVELATRLGPVQRLWVVTDRSDGRFPQNGSLAELRPSVTKEFTPTLSGSFDAIAVTLYIRHSG